MTQPSTTPRALFLEDNEEMLLLASTALRRSGYDITFCGRGVEALVRIFEGYRDNQPYTHLILDCALPHFDGFTVAQVVRLVEALVGVPRARLAFFTAYARTVEMSGLLEKCGADDYWLKDEITRDKWALPQKVQEFLEA